MPKREPCAVVLVFLVCGVAAMGAAGCAVIEEQHGEGVWRPIELESQRADSPSARQRQMAMKALRASGKSPVPDGGEAHEVLYVRSYRPTDPSPDISFACVYTVARGAPLTPRHEDEYAIIVLMTVGAKSSVVEVLGGDAGILQVVLWRWGDSNVYRLLLSCHGQTFSSSAAGGVHIFDIASDTGRVKSIAVLSCSEYMTDRPFMARVRAEGANIFVSARHPQAPWDNPWGIDGVFVDFAADGVIVKRHNWYSTDLVLPGPAE